jgi:hypothetical protein
MAITDVIVEWSGWSLTVVSTVVAVWSVRDARREKVRRQAAVQTLARATQTSGRSDCESVARSVRDQEVRAALIHGASTSSPLRMVLARTGSLGADVEAVRGLALMLRRAGLLAFQDPLTADTTLRLNA